MNVLIQCAHCNASLNAKNDSIVGKKLKCPKCQQAFVAKLAHKPTRKVSSEPTQKSQPPAADTRTRGDSPSKRARKLANAAPTSAKPSVKPVIFLAFANDRDDTVGYLRNLPDEARRIRAALERAEQAELCEVVVRTNSTAQDIFKVFQDPKYRNRIAIFHYGGHANGYALLLESASGQTVAADAGGLSGFLGQQLGLKLVFLNGCSTQQQTQGLLDASVPAVISTSRSIDDKVATDFSSQFYQGLAGGTGVRTAYNEAEAAVQMVNCGDIRSLYLGNKDEPNDRSPADNWPWNLYTREGAESVHDWNLPDAVDDPLFGLPPLPEQDLPESPYRHLNWFTRRDAEVFFGRGRQIRELFDRLTASRTAPIILFYGQSGVGKSSILDAGLIPRLDHDHEVRYLRRDQQQGLTGTLQLAFLSEANNVPIEIAWQTKEDQLDKPLIVFLDQVEELFTRPHADMSPADELAQFLQVLKSIFVETNRRPQGKLVLGFRKEWLAELEARLIDFELPRSRVFLEPLDHRGVMEVVRGPARSERLRDRYGLIVDDALPEIIADDLLADRDSAIAPTLQILLTKMWTQATALNYEHPSLSQELYQRLKRDGILLRDFLNQQIATFRERYPVAVDSGLLLDIVALHTTPLGTADECTVEQLQQQYAHLGATLPDLLQRCQDLHLLTVATDTKKESTKTTRLAHDTLAPLVRERFDESDKPGQRARRILDNRSVDWHENREGTPLDEADLMVVEQGAGGTRALNTTEQRLLTASRELRRRLQRTRKTLKTIGAVAVAAIAILAVFGWWNFSKAESLNTDLVKQTDVAETETAKALNANAALVKKTIEAEAATNKAERNLAQSNLLKGMSEIDNGNYSRGLSYLFAAYDIGQIEDCEPHPSSARSLIAGWSPSAPAPLLHESMVLAVAFSPDGKTVLTGSEHGTARLWDSVTGVPRGEPIAHPAFNSRWMAAVAFSPDGKTILTGCDQTAQLWDAVTGSPRGEPMQHKSYVRTVAFSPDGKTVLTGGADNIARFWDAETGSPQGKRIKHEYPVNTVAFSPDGETVLTGCDDGTARLYDAVTCEQWGETMEHEKSIEAVAFSPDGKTVLTGSNDNTARLWDVETGELRGKPMKHVGRVNAVDFSPDGKTVLTGSDDRTARLWEAKTGTPRREPMWHEYGVKATAFSPDGKTVLTGCEDGTACLWAQETRATRRKPMKHDDWVNAVAFSPDGNTLLTGCDDGIARFWVAQTGAPLGEQLEHEDIVNAVAFSPDGKTVLTGSDDNTAQLWNAETGEPMGDPMEHEGWVYTVAFSPDGNSMLTGSEDGFARLWDTATCELRGEPMKHEERVSGVAFSPDGKTVITASADNTARLWDAKNGESRGEPMKHKQEVNAVTFSPDGKTVLTGSVDKTARLWDAKTCTPRGKPMRHNRPIEAVAFSPNGKTVITASLDKTTRFWEVETCAPCGEPMQHEDFVNAVAYSPDGKTVVTGGSDNTARLWDVPLPALDEHARLKLSVEVRTGLFFDEGTLKTLKQSEWLKRKEQLKALGGPCDIVR